MRKPTIFLSYSRTDRILAEEVRDAIAPHCSGVWADWASIPVGEDWWQEILKGIEAADILLILLSEESASSPVCADELNYAKLLNKRIIPIALEPVARISPWIAALHHLVLIEGKLDKESEGRLIAIINEDPEDCRRHTEILEKALEWEREEKNSSYLMRGDALKEGLNWLARSDNNPPVPTKLHREYLIKSQRSQSILRWGLVAIIFLGAIAAYLVENFSRNHC